jgi:hypothetical protein
MVSVDVKEFSANSPLDYADLNKLVLAIKTVAAAMPTVTTPAAGSNSPASGASAPTFLYGSYFAENAPPLTTKSTGNQYTIPYTRNGVPVTFSTPPFVIAWASTGKAGSGMAIINKAGAETSTNFDVRIGWASRKMAGNVNVGYLAIGNEIKA